MNYAQFSKAAYVGLHNALRNGTISTLAERFEVENAVRKVDTFDKLPQRVQQILKPAFDAMDEFLEEASAARKSAASIDDIKSAASIDDIEVKALPFRRRLRMEPYDPDAVDGDGDGIVQDGTPWERPVGTRALTESGKHFAKGTMLNRRPAGLRLVDADGNDVQYSPKVSRIPEVGLQRIASATQRRKPQRQPVIEPPKKVTTPLGQLGHPTLRERGHADLDDFVDPPPHPPQPPVVPALHDLTDDLDTNIERVRSADSKAFPDLPPRSGWPPDLPVSPGDIADAREHEDEAFAMETTIRSTIENAIYDLMDRLDSDYEMSIPEEVAKMLILAALGYTPGHFDKHDVGLEIEKVAQDLAAQADQRAETFLTTAMNTGVPVVQVNVFDLMEVIKGGRYKSQFETGTSRGFLDPTNRAQWEQDYLDQPVNMEDRLRPVYGLLQLDESGFTSPSRNAARQYGNARIVLRDDVKDRALLTIGDSLGTGAQPWPMRGSGLPFEPTSAYSKSALSAEMKYLLTVAMREEVDNLGRTLEIMLEDLGIDIEEIFPNEGEIMYLIKDALGLSGQMPGMPLDLQDIGDFPWFKTYIEMQILGGLSLYDISEIIFANSAEHDFEGSEEFKALIKVLRELGIPFQFSDTAMKGLGNGAA